MKIVIAEDEADTQQLLRTFFSSQNYTVFVAANGLEAIDICKAEAPDIVLLDVRMPVLDGWGALAAIRQFSQVPIIMVTALGDTQDTVRGLSLGADDYISKPFDFSELQARIEAVLRRTSVPAEPYQISFGNLKIDDNAKTVTLGGSELKLTPKEFALLILFAKRPETVLSTDQIIKGVWGDGAKAGPGDVKQYMHLLRKKLTQQQDSDVTIETVKGFGYKITLI